MKVSFTRQIRPFYSQKYRSENLKEGLNVPILTLIKFHLKTVCDIAKTKPPKNKALQSIKR